MGRNCKNKPCIHLRNWSGSEQQARREESTKTKQDKVAEQESMSLRVCMCV